ncbi:arginine ABC transporter ATP-binding protein [Citrobacter amalonaticus Y19]|uniref:Arginine ABC transporter ATP-binding protein n=1 Tax=Citrobacter amalonaticus Y19 TaxID=1261127 RepID=A0A0F6RFG6_CITAM|nr:ectoine/hydroxyectoine ABC transporter ATP-binding protein EhuA [Citrobacter amalonaticus]AKE59395.1 arginine ABC transporter ATP-binding protein [Citrobacter amalonaticus Y19]
MNVQQQTNGQPLVRFNHVDKYYGKLRVLHDLNLDIPAFEKLAIIGPSGSGKSTVLRTLMTLEQIDSGTIEVEGELLSHVHRNGHLIAAPDKHIRQIRKKIGMVFQNFNLFPHMTVMKNVIEAPIKALGLSKAEAEERAVSLLQMVGLMDKSDLYPSQLSGGQQQRVAIARALVMRPKIMLFDEVTSALDPSLCNEVLQVIRQLGEQHKLTMIMVTHQMGFIKEFADRVCFFCHGNILEQGAPADILNHPQTERLQQFLNG